MSFSRSQRWIRSVFLSEYPRLSCRWVSKNAMEMCSQDSFHVLVVEHLMQSNPFIGHSTQSLCTYPACFQTIVIIFSFFVTGSTIDLCCTQTALTEDMAYSWFESDTSIDTNYPPHSSRHSAQWPDQDIIVFGYGLWSSASMSFSWSQRWIRSVFLSESPRLSCRWVS